MILNNVVTATLPLAAQLTAKGLYLTALPGSVLGQLTHLSENKFDQTAYLSWSGDTDSENWIANDIVNATSDGDISGPHSIAHNSLVDDLSLVVRQHTKFAKNTVNVLRTELGSRLQVYLESSPNYVTVNSLQVITYDLPELLRNEMFLHSLEEFRDMEVRAVRGWCPQLGAKPNDQVLEMLLSGDTRTDDLIKEWVTGVNLEFIWNSNFSEDQVSPTPLMYNGSTYPTLPWMVTVNADGMFKDERYTSITTITAALFLYLVANKYEQSPELIPEVGDMVSAKNYLSDLRFYTGAVLARCLNSFALYERGQNVVLESGHKTTVVYAPVYRSYLEEGGSVEAIFGKMISGSGITTKALLLETHDRLVRSYVQFSKLEEISNSNKKLDMFKEITTIYFHDMLSVLTPEETQYIAANPGYLADVSDMSNEYIKNIDISDTQYPCEIALNLIGKCRFYFTAAYEILKDIDKISTDNSDMAIRECALLATVNYVTDFLYDQLKAQAYGISS